MESTSTSFSSLPSAGADGHSKSYLNDGSDASSRQIVVDHHSPSASGENDTWKTNHQYYDNPLHAAVSAVLNVPAPENAGENGGDMRGYGKEMEHHHIWSTKRDLNGDTKISLGGLHQQHNFLSALEVVQNGSGEAQDLSKQQQQHDEQQQSVVRQAIVKMEQQQYGLSNGGDNQSQQQQSHPSVLTSLHSGIIMQQQQAPPSQHVEVIQKVGGHQPLSHHLSHDHLSPKQHDHHAQQQHHHNEASVLQVMEKMQVPVAYDPSAMMSSYQQRHAAAASIYNGGKMPGMANVYEHIQSSSAYGLSGLSSASHVLPAYSNLLAAGPDYYVQRPAADYYAGVRPLPSMYHQVVQDGTEELLDRYNRIGRQHSQVGNNLYKPVTVDLPSPVDSGLGQEIMVTPKQENVDSIFTYTDLQQSVVQQLKTSGGGKDYHPRPPPATERHAIIAGRDSPIHIPKIITHVGFQYSLDSPLSTSVRKEDDRMTYVNKGQFYTVSLQYIPDPNKPLKSTTVKSILMCVFREDKPCDEELKCWQFWHTRQHSAKQRILDVDTKNSTGLIGSVEEIAHNAVAFYWSVQDQPAKVNVAVQCLSTDFSNQKGVKGLPLHLQIDTFDESHSKSVPFHRGYCQIKVFCDKGANRKMLHEQRREEKRKLSASPFNSYIVEGRKKTDGEFHEACDRSEFYHMSNLTKPAVLFVPPEDYDRFPPLESFYTLSDPNNLNHSGLIKDGDEPRAATDDDEEESASTSPSPKKPKIYPSLSDRGNDRMMIYVKRTEEHIFTPLHLLPPNVEGLTNAISDKYAVDKAKISGVFKQCRKGITVKMDDDMVRHYCNEDTFLMDVEQSEDAQSFNITLIELETH